MERLGGIMVFKIGGRKQPAEGDFTYGMGANKREPLMGSSGDVQGFSEAGEASYIEGSIRPGSNVSLKEISNITDETVELVLPNGKTLALLDAFYAGESKGETGEGNYDVKFYGSDIIEI